jgi:hypothetical protein
LILQGARPARKQRGSDIGEISGLMYLMYVDESGDCGTPADGSPTSVFCLSGIVVHELRWRDALGDLADFRRRLWREYRINIEDELHAGELISNPAKLPQSLQRLRKHQRLAVIRQFADRIASMRDISAINVAVHKRCLPPTATKAGIFRRAWYALFQRFENTIRCRNFPGPKDQDDRGVVFADDTDSGKLRKFLNDMRQHNLLKVRGATGEAFYDDQPIRALIEDPVMRDSRESYFIQAADCSVYLLKQSIDPCSFMKRHGGNAYFKRLEPILCKHASRTDPLGVVRL